MLGRKSGKTVGRFLRVAIFVTVTRLSRVPYLPCAREAYGAIAIGHAERISRSEETFAPSSSRIITHYYYYYLISFLEAKKKKRPRRFVSTYLYVVVHRLHAPVRYLFATLFVDVVTKRISGGQGERTEFDVFIQHEFHRLTSRSVYQKTSLTRKLLQVSHEKRVRIP